jgi:hypothetical protein
VLAASVALAMAGVPPAAAAELDGVSMPDQIQYHGVPLRLNGMGLRTYSVFRVHIYVAGLYLEKPNEDADAILRSSGVRMLHIRFVHDVTVDRARAAWAEGLADNCKAPCHLPPQDVERFLAAVPEFHRGDDSTLVFEGDSVRISLNGRALGTVSEPTFTRAILSTFIGPYPPSEPFKRALLGKGN